MALQGITIRTVQSLEPGQTIWDAGHKAAVKGFGARRQRGDAVYVVKFRVLGRQRFITIGPHGSPWTPDRARKEAKRLLGLAAAGKDPQAAKKQARADAANTLGKVAENYLQHAQAKLKPRTYAETKRHLLVNWKPLHSTSIFHIARRHVAERLRDIAGSRGAATAAGARAALSAMFNWAIREGYEIGANPVFGTNKPTASKARDRVLTDQELAEIWDASGDSDYGRIIKLLILTGQRRDEVGGMHWSEIDQDKKTWTIPGARTKNHREHVVPLSDTALELITGVPPRKDRNHVFGEGPRRNGDRHRGYSGWSKSKAALEKRIPNARKAARGAGQDASKIKLLLDWRLHDLRRTAATVMADRLRVLPHIIEAILNHVSGHRAGVAGVYNRARYETEMRDALKRWSEHVEAMITHGETSPR
jgi:integrase